MSLQRRQSARVLKFHERRREGGGVREAAMELRLGRQGRWSPDGGPRGKEEALKERIPSLGSLRGHSAEHGCWGGSREQQ